MKYFLSVSAFWPPSRPKPPAPPSSHRGQYELTLGRTWPGGATTGDSHPMDPWTHRHRRHRPSLTSLYIVAYCGCFCHVAFFFAGQFAAIAFPSWKTATTTPSVPLCRTRSCRGQRQSGWKSSKIAKNKSIFVFENMIELGHVMQSVACWAGTWYDKWFSPRWGTRDAATYFYLLLESVGQSICYEFILPLVPYELSSKNNIYLKLFWNSRATENFFKIV